MGTPVAAGAEAVEHREIGPIDTEGKHGPVRRDKGVTAAKVPPMGTVPAYRDMIQDPVVTVRDDRYCIPVKAEYRAQFGGLVHDTEWCPPSG